MAIERIIAGRKHRPPLDLRFIRTLKEIDMKSFVFLLLSVALHAGAAEPLKPATQKTAWFSGLQGLKEAMKGINGLGENMAQRPGAELSQLGNLENPFRNLELIKPAADIHLGLP